MPEIGLFPLELVLLPTERVPLHIFEPRYKELIQECLALGTEFGLLLEDEEGQREIGTRAAVIEVLQVFDDGRMNVVVEGRERFRVVEPTEGRPFATADVEPVVDEEDVPSAAEVEQSLSVFKRLAEAAEVEIDEPIPESSPTLTAAPNTTLRPRKLRSASRAALRAALRQCSLAATRSIRSTLRRRTR